MHSGAQQLLVGAEGFEPTTSSSQSWRSTRLSYTPISNPRLRLQHRSFEMLRVTLRPVNPYRSTPNTSFVRSVRRCPVERVQTMMRASYLALYGAPGEIRTPDHQVRSLVLYPTELRARLKLLPCRLTIEVESAEARSGIIQIRAVIVNTFFRFFSPSAEAFISR